MRYTRWLRLMNDQNPPFVPFSIALLITASLALLEARMGSLLILGIAFGGFVVAATVRGRAAVIGACAGSTLAGLSMLVLAPGHDVRHITEIILVGLFVFSWPFIWGVVGLGYAVGRLAVGQPPTVRPMVIAVTRITYVVAVVAGLLLSPAVSGAVCRTQEAAPAADADIAFSDLTADGKAAIFTMAADGRAVHRLLAGVGVDPLWSPDGRRVAFESDEYVPEGVYVMAADGSCPHRVADGAGPTWSPDGHRLATRIPGSTGDEIQIVSLQDAATRRFPAPGGGFALGLAWSPDGSGIAVGSVDGLSIIDPEDGRVIDRPVESGRVLDPAWSPDSRLIAYNADASNIVVVGRDGSVVGGIHNGMVVVEPAFDRSGTRLAYAESENGKTFEIWVAALDGSDARVIGSADKHATSPSWRWR